MARMIFALTAVLLTLLTGGCQSEFRLALFNGLDRGIVATVGRTTKTLAPGQSDKLPYPSVTGESPLQIAIGNCKFTYRLTNDLVKSYPEKQQLHGFLPVQLAPDMKLYFQPSGSAGTMPITELKAFQQGDFALGPASRECHAG